MCGKNTTTTSASTPNPYAMSAYSDRITQAGQIGQLPFTPYGGEFVAPVNRQQQLAGANINNAAGEAQPFIQQAGQFAVNAAQPITAQQIQNYQNPYTQQVVQATENQFNQQNAQQQNQLMGNAAAQGALGGDRLGLAQANLAGQQQLAEAPTIAGLYSSGYGQALNTALAEQQQQAQAAYSLGNLGVAGQNAALQGAGAQLGYGTLGQQTQQGLDTAQYQQFLAEQGFPYQQAMWETGIDTGVGSQMGGTNVTQGPQPNPLSSYGGLALAGLAMIKDGGRINANSGGRIANCGRAIGGPIAGFAMGGMPYSSLGGDDSYIPSLQITPGHTMPGPPGSSGQQAAQNNPIQQANQILGLNKALSGSSGDPSTFSAQVAGLESGLSPDEVGFGEIGAFRRGGQIRGFDDGGSVFDDFNADFSPTTGSMPSYQGGNPPTSADQSAGFADRFGAAYNNGQPTLTPMVQPDSVSIAGGNALPASQSFTGNPAGVQAGVPSFGQAAAQDLPPATNVGPGRIVPRGIRNNNPGNIEAGSFAQTQPGYVGSDGRFARFDSPQAGHEAQVSLLGKYAEQGINTIHGVVARWAPASDGNDVRAYSDYVARQLGVAPNQQIDLTNPQVASKVADAMGQFENGTGGGHAGMGSISSFAPASELGGRGQAQQTQQDQQGFFGNPLHLSPNMRQALLAAGFGMMASRSPYLGNAIGEGGLAGLNAYGAAQQHEQAQHKEAFNEDLAIKKLDQSAKQHADTLAHQTRLEQQAQERIDQGKFQMVPGMGPGPNGEQVPGAYRFNTKNGEQEFVPGVNLTQKGSATQGSMSPQAIEISARQLVNGDLSGLTNVGRGAQGSQLLAAIRSRAAEILTAPDGEYKYSPQQAAEYLGGMTQGFRADQVGQSAGARTSATRAANLGIILDVANAAVPNAISLSDQVYRVGFVPLDRLIQGGQIMTNDPLMNRFAVANLQLAESWAKAMNPTGVMRESDRDIALKMLSTAKSPDAYKAVVAQIKDNIDREMEGVRKFQGSQRPNAAGSGSPAASTPQAAPAGGGGGGATVVGQVRQNGHIYNKMSDGTYQPVQ